MDNYKASSREVQNLVGNKIDELEEYMNVLEHIDNENTKVKNLVEKIMNFPLEKEYILENAEKHGKLNQEFNELTELQIKSNNEALERLHEINRIYHGSLAAKEYEEKVEKALKEPKLEELKELMKEYDDEIDEDVKEFIDDQLMVDLYDAIAKEEGLDQEYLKEKADKIVKEIDDLIGEESPVLVEQYEKAKKIMDKYNSSETEVKNLVGKKIKELEEYMDALEHIDNENTKVKNLVEKIMNFPLEKEYILENAEKHGKLNQEFNELTELQIKSNNEALERLHEINRIYHGSLAVKGYEERVEKALKEPNLEELEGLMKEYDDKIEEDLKEFIDEQLMIDLYDAIEREKIDEIDQKVLSLLSDSDAELEVIEELIEECNKSLFRSANGQFS